MSATIRLSSKLPGDPEINGLDHLHDRLCVDTTPIVCLAWVKPTKVVTDIETEERVPTVELARVEPIGSVNVVSQEIIALAAQLYEKRTGRNPLPIDALLVPSGEISKVDEAEIIAAARDAETLMGMSPDEREDAMSDGPGLALLPDPDADLYVFDGEVYGDE